MEDITLNAENAAAAVGLSAMAETSPVSSGTDSPAADEINSPMSAETGAPAAESAETADSAAESNPDTKEADAGESESDNGSDISFADLGLDDMTLEAIRRKGFVTPSPIQV